MNKLLSLINIILLSMNAQNTAKDATISGGTALPSSKLLEFGVMPKPIKRVPPAYPISLARSGSEGWVQLSLWSAKMGLCLTR